MCTYNVYVYNYSLRQDQREHYHAQACLKSMPEAPREGHKVSKHNLPDRMRTWAVHAELLKGRWLAESFVVNVCTSSVDIKCVFEVQPNVDFQHEAVWHGASFAAFYLHRHIHDNSCRTTSNRPVSLFLLPLYLPSVMAVTTTVRGKGCTAENHLHET